MRYFEAKFTLRHVTRKQLNHYKIHQQVEKVIAGDEFGDKVKTRYLFDYVIDENSNSASVSVRTLQRTNLPGEVEHNASPFIGQSVSFWLHFKPKMSQTKGNKSEVYIENQALRYGRLLDRLIEAGLDVVNFDEIEETYRKFKKGRHSFVQRGARYKVDAVIVDPAKFEIAFTNGVGPKASFGYGKMILIPGGE
tara:strand:- start:4024 stop:4605 length:582 start_codon:yes stop_codon:yes gene_type:complete